MSNFIYQALDPQKKVINGVIEAADRQSALALLTRQNLQPIDLTEKTTKSFGKSFFSGSIGTPRIKGNALVMFTRQLSTMLGAGVPLLRALSGLQRNAPNKGMKDILQAVCDDIQGGAPLASALAKHPKTFNSIYVNMVRAGETAGILDETLSRLATQQEKAASMKKKIRGAMAYPLVLLVIIVLAFFGLMIFVLPQIGKVVKNLGGPDAKLPLLTTVMLGISGFVVHYWYLIILVGGGGVFLLVRFIRTKPGRAMFHRFVLRVPILKDAVIKTSVARFARTFSALLGAGVGIVESLSVTAHALGNVVFEDTLMKAVEEIKTGKQLSSVLEHSPIFPTIIPQMLAVGEETGKIDIVLIKVAEFYEEEVDVLINSLGAIIEPLMIVVMGAMVGLIVASVMGPITGLASQIH